MTELERNTRIFKEFNRINVYFENLDENQKSIISPLIQNAAFMRVALDDLQEIINREGMVERYQNGENQYGMKQSAALQSYNALVKNYAAVIKNLFGLLSKMERSAIKPLMIREKTQEEIAASILSDEERLEKINREIAAAAAMQQRQREKEWEAKR